jgi:hypothetical protein
VQPPPGIGISPIADMEGRQTIAAAAPASKSSAEMTEERWLSRHGISRPPVAPTTPATWLNACHQPSHRRTTKGEDRDDDAHDSLAAPQRRVRVAVDRNGHDVLADGRLPFGALAEVDRQPERWRRSVLIRHSPNHRSMPGADPSHD